MHRQTFTFVALSFLVAICGCNDPAGPTAAIGAPLSSKPTTRETPTETAVTPNWRGDAAVVAVTVGSSPACGWGTSPGATRNGVDWQITRSVDAIWLDEDLSNWQSDDVPYSGQVSGAQFSASYASDSTYADYVCAFREASITGRFTSDSTFEAVETLIWGRPGTETTVVRHWNGWRL